MLDKRDGKAAPRPFTGINQNTLKPTFSRAVGYIENVRFHRTVVRLTASQIETKPLRSMLKPILRYFNLTHFLI